jgi:hypothetical protein
LGIVRDEQASLLFAKLTPIKKETSFQNLSNSKIERLQRDIHNLEKLIKKEARPRPVTHSLDK